MAQVEKLPVSCEACKETLEIPKHFQGKPIKCPHCGHDFIISFGEAKISEEKSVVEEATKGGCFSIIVFILFCFF